MKSIKVALLLCFCVALAACPYKETYRYKGEAFEINALRVQPSKVHYKQHADSVTCGVGFSVLNSSSNSKEVNLKDSYLQIDLDTLWLRGIYKGNPKALPPNTTLTITPEGIISFSLAFTGKLSQFKQELKIHLINSNIDTVIAYQKIR